MPKPQSINAYNLINSQIKQGLPLNIGLIMNKYVNKFVLGYLKDQKWEEGKQSEIKRQIYLLKKERIEALEKLQEISKKGFRIKYVERNRVIEKSSSEILKSTIESLEQCDIDEAIRRLRDNIKKVRDKNIYIYNELKSIQENLSKIKLGISHVPQTLYEIYCKRIDSILQTLKTMEYEVKEAILTSCWRLIINLGAASVYETSLLFHRNYSVPYIPGSAVKGVTKHWAIQKFAEYCKKSIKDVSSNLENSEDLGFEVDGIAFKELIEIFGTQNKKGKVLFFDAFPIFDKNKDFIVLDVMNVHYKPYYEGSAVPGDWYTPTPIFFLTVEKGTKFRFALASKDSELTGKTTSLLKEALENFGIGAKTSAGYGCFKA